MAVIDTTKFLEVIHDAYGLRVANLELSTLFRKLNEWDSMVAVFIAAAAYDHYDVQVSSEDLLTCNTLEDLKKLIESRLPSQP
ncbi:MAG: acyl carrier protein [Verrucomicrobiales bacterium]